MQKDRLIFRVVVPSGERNVVARFPKTRIDSATIIKGFSGPFSLIHLSSFG
jgi:hypothetical protein